MGTTNSHRKLNYCELFGTFMEVHCVGPTGPIRHFQEVRTCAVRMSQLVIEKNPKICKNSNGFGHIAISFVLDATRAMLNSVKLSLYFYRPRY